MLIVAGAAGGFWRFRQDPDPLAGLDTAVAVNADIEDAVTALGKIQPHDYVDVGAQVTGQLKRIAVEPGAQVKAGVLLAEIDPQLQLAKLELDRAQLAQQEAERDVQRLQVEFATAQHARQLRMRGEGATREDAVERAHSEMRMATAKLAAIEAQIRQTRSTTKADEAQLGYTRIFAPLSGTVVSVDAREGQTLVAVQQAPVLLRIAVLSSMTVWSQVSEVEVNKLRPGMDLYFTVLGQPDRKWPAKLRQLLPAPVKPTTASGAASPAPAAANNNIVVYTALFDVDNSAGELMPEMSAQVFFVCAAAKAAVVIPAVALADAGVDRNKNDNTVTVIDAAGRRETRAVKVGVRNRFDVQIVSGLSAGERVLKPEPDGAQALP